MLSIYRLPNTLPDEKVIKVVRRDIFILLRKIFLITLLMILPFIFFYLLINSDPKLLVNELAVPVFVLGISAYYLFIWLFSFFSFIDYYLDIWIITNERIIDIQQQGFFSRVIAENKIFRIQDVTSEVNGLFSTILAFGDVYVQTAGTKQRFRFHQVPHPNRIRDMIIKLVERKKNEVQQEEKRERLEKPA